MNALEELRQHHQWVCWRTVTRNGKPTKVPYRPNGKEAASNDRSTWSSYDAVAAAVDRFDGIGFVFAPDDEYAGIDIDRALVDGNLHPAVIEIIRALDSYTEWSPSGNGVHVLARACKPAGSRSSTKKTPWGDELAVYDQLRYFAITGNALPKTPRAIENRQVEIEALLARFMPSKNGGKSETKSKAKQTTSKFSVEKILAEDEVLARIAKREGKAPQDASRTGWDHYLACQAMRNGCTDDEVCALIRHVRGLHGEEGELTDSYIKRTVNAARAKVPADDRARLCAEIGNAWNLGDDDPITGGRLIGPGDGAIVHLYRVSGAVLVLGHVHEMFEARAHTRIVSLATKTRFKALTPASAADVTQMIIQLCEQDELDEHREHSAQWMGDFVRDAGAEVDVSDMKTPAGRWNALKDAKNAKEKLPKGRGAASVVILRDETDAVWIPAGPLRASLAPGAPSWRDLDAILAEQGWRRIHLDMHEPDVPRSKAKHLEGAYYVEPDVKT